MIITKPGRYQIHPPLTAQNSHGAYYQIRIVKITEIDTEARKVFCVDLGWVGWDLPVKEDKKK